MEKYVTRLSLSEIENMTLNELHTTLTDISNKKDMYPKGSDSRCNINADCDEILVTIARLKERRERIRTYVMSDTARKEDFCGMKICYSKDNEDANKIIDRRLDTFTTKDCRKFTGDLCYSKTNELHTKYNRMLDDIRAEYMELLRSELTTLGITEGVTKVYSHLNHKVGVLRINNWAYEWESPYTASVSFVPFNKDGTLSKRIYNVDLPIYGDSFADYIVVYFEVVHDAKV